MTAKNKALTLRPVRPSDKLFFNFRLPNSNSTNSFFRYDSTNVSTVNVVKSKGQRPKPFKKPVAVKEPTISILNLVQERMRDSIRLDTMGKKTVIISVRGDSDSVRRKLIDSFHRMSGRVRTISVVSPDSMNIKDKMVGKVFVDEGRETILRELPSEKSLADKEKAIIEKTGGMFIESELPPPPFSGATGAGMPPESNDVIRLLYNVDSLTLKDSVTVKEITDAYEKRLKEDDINVGFAVQRLDSTEILPSNAVTIGLSKPASYALTIEDTFSYMFGKLKLPLLFSILLVGITIASFVLLYRNMLKQQRLAALKNEFISNITHELKTPIATVGVAIEALKNFNAIDNPERTQEYLSISQNELQRLNLLVDKVLKLSMFEKKEIELKYEVLDLKDLAAEVIGSMRLQIEKYRATVTLEEEGNTVMRADRLHLLSVIFNLLDNALKYSKQHAAIIISVKEKDNHVVLSVADNGIGIPAEYKNKVFEKFFRVPQGDTHNAKGYGLGLSYAAHVVQKHKGTIEVESEQGAGTRFIISIPKNLNEA